MKTHNRVFAIVLVLMFVLPVIGSGIAVVYQIAQDRKTADATKQLTDAQNNLQNQAKESKLEGTKLENFTPVDNVTELQRIDTVVGSGEEVKPGATVTAHYTGAVASTGVIFQSSHDSGQPIPFSLNSVIKGWTDGVPGMKVGGKRRLVIPADQAYGATPPSGSGIPANAPLVFDIEVTAVQQ